MIQEPDTFQERAALQNFDNSRADLVLEFGIPCLATVVIATVRPVVVVMIEIQIYIAERLGC